MLTLLKSSGAVAVATMASRVLGLAREVVYAGFMGAGWVADAFAMAYMVPNLFRRLLGEGALTAAFIPIFKEREKLSGEEAMWRAANAVISGLVVVLAGITLIAVVVISAALGWSGWEGKTRLMLELLRVMFPYLVLICVAALWMGMLNARGHFFVPALGSALLNVALIGSVFWIAPRFGEALHEQIFGVAIGVLVAGLLQVAFQWRPLFREGFRYQWVSPWKDATVHRVVAQMVPGIVGVAAYQINILLTNGIAFWAEDAIVASYNYAVRLMELPQGVFGLSLASSLLPALAGFAAERKHGEFREMLGRGLGYLLVVNVLASVWLAVLAEPIIRLLFERGRFDSHDTNRAAMALMFLAPGLLAYSGVNVVARAFYALGDVGTPMRISVVCLGMNVVLVLALVWRFREAGLGFGNTVTAALNLGLLGYALRRKLPEFEWARVLSHWRPVGIAGVMAGGAAWGLWRGWESRWGHEGLWARMGEVFVPMLGSAVVYGAVCYGFRVPFILDMVRIWRGRGGGGLGPG